MLSLFEIAALLLAFSAFFGWFNHVVLRLPHTIGLLVMALVSSLVLLLAEEIFPGFGLTVALQGVLGQIDFYATVMEGMLAFLLFAGALHVDFSFLRDQKWAIGTLATIGVAISTAVIGTGFWIICDLLGAPIPFAWALVFGALISPTDPVAVLSLLKSVNVPHSLEAKIAGESLFNDGVGVVIFTILLAIAAGGADSGQSDAAHIAQLFFVEAGGGAILGLACGWIAYRAMAALDNYTIEILITLGVVSATYAVASRLHLSGPIAVVTAGLLVGNRGAMVGMSETTREHLFNFWELIDEILNSVLFLLIGLEVLVIALEPSFGWIAAVTIPLVVGARLVAVSVPLVMLGRFISINAGSIPVLTWGGLRGGISVALALSLPAVAHKPLILAATYGVVLFSIIVQGMTVKAVIGRTVDPTLL